MLDLPTPPEIPFWLEVTLWSGLVAWLLYLGLRGGRLGSAELAMSLCGASFPLTAAAVVATEAWDRPDARSFIHVILWMAMTLGVSGVVIWLHHRTDGPDDGDDDGAADPVLPMECEGRRSRYSYTGPRPGARGPSQGWHPERSAPVRRGSS